MLPTRSSATTTTTAPPIDVLILDRAVAGYGAGLRDKYRVTVATSAQAALDVLRQTTPSLVVAELEVEVEGGSAIDVCRHAKALSVPSTVLVTTEDVERVPEALRAGCDGVLLKPFPPNLLHARVGRLVRARANAMRSAELHLRSDRALGMAEHLRDRIGLFMAGTNQHWPTAYCPYCAHQGVTSFEYASHRKAWYACLECKKVWVAKRQE